MCETTYVAESNMQRAWRVLRADKTSTQVAVVVSPAARVAIGERFGFARGEDAFYKTATALKKIGADFVVDGAYFTGGAVKDLADILEERITTKNLPLIVGSGHFVARAKEKYPTLADKFCVFAPIVEGAEKIRAAFEKDGKKTEIIAIVPCKGHGGIDGLHTLTTNELAVMFQSACISLRKLGNTQADAPFDTYTGAGVLAGVSGGLSEAVAGELVAEKENLKKLEYSGLRGAKPFKEAIVELDGGAAKFAVACGHENVFALLDKIAAGDETYTFVETACRVGGCLFGEGQPQPMDEMTGKLRELGLYRLNEQSRLDVAEELEESERETELEDEDDEENGLDYETLSHIRFEEMNEEQKAKWVYYRTLSRAERRKIARRRRKERAQKLAEKLAQAQKDTNGESAE